MHVGTIDLYAHYGRLIVIYRFPFQPVHVQCWIVKVKVESSGKGPLSASTCAALPYGSPQTTCFRYAMHFWRHDSTLSLAKWLVSTSMRTCTPICSAMDDLTCRPKYAHIPITSGLETSF